MKRLIWLIFALLFVAQPAAAKEKNPIDNEEVINLQAGLNTVPQLTPDGKDGSILQAWRDNGNAHGYFIYVVMNQDYDVISVADHGKFDDIIIDEPHTIEDYVKSIRFVRGKMQGESGIFLVTAARDPAKARTMLDASKVAFDIFKLVSFGNGVGATKDYFEFKSTMHSTNKYCNSDLALHNELGFPLPKNYAGPNLINGCP